MKFSAVILAGGRSRRMGQDKAFIQRNGQCLLAQQIRTVQQLFPEEVFISGRPGVDYGAFGCPILHDAFQDRGPLAGIEQAFESTHSPLLLVLAVDMPLMKASFLQQLAKSCSDTLGAVPQVQQQLQPLAAFYPKSAHQVLLTVLGEGMNSATQFAEFCSEAGMVQMRPVSQRDAVCFANWNSPADLPQQPKKPCPKSKPIKPDSLIFPGTRTKACNREVKANEDSSLCPSQKDRWKERDRNRA